MRVADVASGTPPDRTAHKFFLWMRHLRTTQNPNSGSELVRDWYADGRSEVERQIVAVDVASERPFLRRKAQPRCCSVRTTFPRMKRSRLGLPSRSAGALILRGSFGSLDSAIRSNPFLVFTTRRRVVSSVPSGSRRRIA